MITGRTALSVLGLSFASSLLLPASGPPAGQSPAADFYKAGPIRLDPDPAFGKDTDWNRLFFDRYSDLTVAPDGSIFIASSRQHRIYQFDPRGNLVTAFGQKGQGPGDLNNPSDLSVLDGKYLVVGAFAANLRISLFDLEGRIDRVLTTKRPYFHPVALREGKIAYIVFNYNRGEGRGATQVIQSVVIRAIDGPREVKVAEHTFGWGGIMLKPGGSMSFGDSIGGQTLIAATKGGDLVVGNSLQPLIEVFSPEGTRISTIDLGLDPVPVTKEYKKRYKDFQLGEMRKEHGSDAGIKEQLKQVENASFDHLFADVLPLYREVLVDADGNLLVFRKTDCLGDCPTLARVYSPEGRFVCETEILEGPFGLAVDNRIKNMSFGSGGLIAMVEVKDAEDFELRLIRVNYRRPPR